MFADVAGSTAMYENMGDEAARERISKALDALISITRRYSGNLVKTIGDEILVYFTDTDKAIFAAQAIQETMEDDRSPETIGVSIRIGMQQGSAILEKNDIFGDTVNVAARVASMAKGRQILCTHEVAILIKNEELSAKMRPYDRLRIKGRNEHLDVYLVAWEEEGDMTNMATASSFTNPARYDQVENLKLTHGKHSYSLPVGTDSFVIGRGKDSELIIQGDLISRHHSRIDHRRGKFILSDQSTNGTFVRTSEGQDIFLRREELALFGSGHISLGKKIDLADFNLIKFVCE
jgi:hypothetical protein